MHLTRCIGKCFGGGPCLRTDEVQEKLSSVRARSRALQSIASDVNLKCSSVAQRESLRALQFLNPSDWKLVAHGGFLRNENIVVLGASLCAVRYAEICYPPGRLLILSDNLTLVLALCKRSSTFYTAFSHPSYLCVWLQCRFCLIFQVDTV